eukprot:TRINITY_DN3149_c2_g1_i1.p1 TRINITY_DN3149_c2_g1~~TRINITY_DN3149_c2_g1_i1.p1  ORF type:complete len:945 (+),score=132.86 TRINITY_DN3149_c2_g1_i1:1642-4476(+)
MKYIVIKFKNQIMEAHRSFRSPSYLPGPLESDPYSLSLVQELLQSTTEWINIQDIVKLTFKALFDTVKMQGEAIKDLEKAIPTKASKAELNSGLSQKANISDVSRTVAEVASNIETRVTLEDIQALLEEKVSRSEFQYSMNGKVGLDEVRMVVDKKVGADEFKSELRTIFAKMDDLKRSMDLQVTTNATLKDLEELRVELAQKASIAEVSAGLQQKASKESVANALKRKANISDVETALTRKAEIEDIEKMFEALNEKADLSKLEELATTLERVQGELKEKVTPANLDAAVDKNLTELKNSISEKMEGMETGIRVQKQRVDDEMEGLRRLVGKKADITEMEMIKALVDKKADIEKTGNELVETKFAANEGIKQVNGRIDVMVKKLEELKEFMEKNVETNYTDLSKLKEQVSNWNEDTRRVVEKTSKQLQSTTAQIKSESQEDQISLKKAILEIKKEMEEIDRKKMERKDLDELNAEIDEKLEPKATVAEVQRAITESQTDVAQKIADLKSEFGKDLRALKVSLESQLSEKADFTDVSATLTKKADRAEVEENLIQKANISELEEVSSSLTNLATEVKMKADAQTLTTDVTRLRMDIDSVSKELAQKSSIKDVCALLDAKANNEDLSKAMAEMHKELARKANGEDLSNTLADQALINEALCAENCVARWLWKSGDLKSGYAIPWEIQSVNTCPDNFLWEKDRTSVLAIAPGLYEITMGFFTKKKPTVQLLINGEAVLSAVNSASYVIHHSSGKLKSVGKHSAGNITGNTLLCKIIGLTLIDFISLPPRARVSVSYSGEADVEGFLGLRKLQSLQFIIIICCANILVNTLINIKTQVCRSALYHLFKLISNLVIFYLRAFHYKLLEDQVFPTTFQQLVKSLNCQFIFAHVKLFQVLVFDQFILEKFHFSIRQPALLQLQGFYGFSIPDNFAQFLSATGFNRVNITV